MTIHITDIPNESFNHYKHVLHVDNELALIEINKDNISDLSKFNYPYKAEAFTLCIVLKGWVKGKINSIEYNAIAPCVISIYPNQILQHDSNSEDFYIICIAFTKNFASNIASYSVDEILLLRFPRQDNISHHLSQETLTALLDYCAYIKKIIADTDNPFRIKSIQHLTVALFYSTVWKQISSYKKNEKTRADYITYEFLDLVGKNFKKYRQLNFYADKLCITAKYLSTTVKNNSGISASEWIKRYVILEAQRLLKNSSMTIQQISNELNFPSQTFFSKYFKHQIGLSPKEYRKS